MAGIPAFSKAKDTYQLVQKARQIEKELKETEVEAVGKTGLTVVFNGQMRMTEIDIPEEYLNPSRKADLEKEIINVAGQAISKAQGVMQEQMKKISGDLNLPGVLRQ
jgi:hypothetical protein